MKQIPIWLNHLFFCKCLILNGAKGENHKAARKGLSSSSLSSSSSCSQITWTLGHFIRGEKPRLPSGWFYSQMLGLGIILLWKAVIYKFFMGAAITASVCLTLKSMSQLLSSKTGHSPVLFSYTLMMLTLQGDASQRSLLLSRQMVDRSGSTLKERGGETQPVLPGSSEQNFRQHYSVYSKVHVQSWGWFLKMWI